MANVAPNNVVAPPGCIITMDDWVVDIWYDRDRYARVGVRPPKLDKKRAILAALKSLKIERVDRVKDIKARRLHEVWTRKSEAQNPRLTERMIERWAK